MPAHNIPVILPGYLYRLPNSGFITVFLRYFAIFHAMGAAG